MLKKVSVNTMRLIAAAAYEDSVNDIADELLARPPTQPRTPL